MPLLKNEYRKSISYNNSGCNLKKEVIPIIRPALSMKSEIEKQYSKLIYKKLQQIERAFDKTFIHEDSLNEDKFVKCIFSGESNKRVKHSTSLRVIQKNSITTLNSIELEQSKIKKNSCVNLQDKDISKLDELSMMNMGARYELLNTNKLMIDLDLGLVASLIIYRIFAS